MTFAEPIRDYYAVLQVHPGAEGEVIEAAYRQLMKKYHPDRAGGDAEEAAALHERAKVINEAYSVLRDPRRRRAYDARRLGIPMGPPPPPPPPTAYSSAAPAPPPAAPVELLDDEPHVWPPLAALAAAYFLLPGRYEWERGHFQDALAVVLVPPIGLIGWALATGRLTPLIGHAPLAPVIAWALLGLACLPVLRLAPRLAIGAAPTVLLLTGNMNLPLTQTHLPYWVAWLAAILIGLVLAARLYVFAVLPTLAAGALLAHFI